MLFSKIVVSAGILRRWRYSRVLPFSSITPFASHYASCFIEVSVEGYICGFEGGLVCGLLISKISRRLKITPLYLIAGAFAGGFILMLNDCAGFLILPVCIL